MRVYIITLLCLFSNTSYSLTDAEYNELNCQNFKIQLKVIEENEKKQTENRLDNLYPYVTYKKLQGEIFAADSKLDLENAKKQAATNADKLCRLHLDEKVKSFKISKVVIHPFRTSEVNETRYFNAMIIDESKSGFDIKLEKKEVDSKIVLNNPLNLIISSGYDIEKDVEKHVVDKEFYRYIFDEIVCVKGKKSYEKVFNPLKSNYDDYTIEDLSLQLSSSDMSHSSVLKNISNFCTKESNVVIEDSKRDSKVIINLDTPTGTSNTSSGISK